VVIVPPSMEISAIFAARVSVVRHGSAAQPTLSGDAERKPRRFLGCSLQRHASPPIAARRRRGNRDSARGNVI